MARQACLRRRRLASRGEPPLVPRDGNACPCRPWSCVLPAFATCPSWSGWCPTCWRRPSGRSRPRLTARLVAEAFPADWLSGDWPGADRGRARRPADRAGGDRRRPADRALGRHFSPPPRGRQRPPGLRRTAHRSARPSPSLAYRAGRQPPGTSVLPQPWLGRRWRCVPIQAPGSRRSRCTGASARSACRGLTMLTPCPRATAPQREQIGCSRPLKIGQFFPN